MKYLMTVLVAGLALTSTAGLAQDKRDGATSSDRDPVFVSVTCDDLTASARARHPSCAPVRKMTQQTLDVPVRLAAREPTAPRRIVRIPWSIGVFQ